MKSWIALSFAIAAALASPIDAHPRESATILEIERPWHGLPQVRVQLNDRSWGRFIVDSAASHTVLTEPMRRRVGLDGQGLSAHANGSTGNSAIRYFRLASLTLGSRRFADVGAFALPSHHAERQTDGIVGADILRRHVAEFDMRGGRLLLHDASIDLQTGDEAHWHAVPADLRADGLLIVHVTIGGVPMPALVDTGATQNIVNREAARRIGLRFVPDSASLIRIGGISGQTQEMNQLRISGFRIGGAELGASRLGVADLAIFETLGLAGQPAMLLSAEAFADRRFAIDYPRQRLLVERRD